MIGKADVWECDDIRYVKFLSKGKREGRAERRRLTDPQRRESRRGKKKVSGVRESERER
jgi:hypothetical protein